MGNEASDLLDPLVERLLRAADPDQPHQAAGAPPAAEEAEHVRLRTRQLWRAWGALGAAFPAGSPVHDLRPRTPPAREADGHSQSGNSRSG